MTSIETYQKSYNNLIAHDDDMIKDKDGNIIPFEKYYAICRSRIDYFHKIRYERRPH